MYEKAKRPTTEKIAEFCENAIMGICRYLRIAPNGEKVCIRETEYDSGFLAQANCQQSDSPIKPPCKHSAAPIATLPGHLKCRGCGQIRKCEHPLVGLNEDGDEVCALCGVITKEKVGAPTKFKVTGGPGAFILPIITGNKKRKKS